MAELLTAIEEPAFNWYLKWIELNEKGQPKTPIKDGMSQPLTIKILWSTPSGREMSCEVTPDKGGREMSCEVTPDKGRSVPKTRWPTPYRTSKRSSWCDGKRIIKMTLSTWTRHSTFFAAAVTKWDLCATKYEGDKRTKKNFKRCLKDYLEAIAKCTHLGDQVIRWLLLRGNQHTCNSKNFSTVESRYWHMSRRSIFQQQRTLRTSVPCSTEGSPHQVCWKA